MTDAPATAPGPAPAPSVPGKTLGIVGLVLAFLAPLIGLILSIVAANQSKKAGVKNTPATVGIVLSIIFLVIGLIIAIAVGVGGASLFGMCAGLEPGVYTLENGGTLTCG